MSTPVFFAHPQALVESEHIGSGTRIWAFAHVMKGARVGRDCNIGEGAFIEGGARVGDGVTVKNGALVWEGVTLEDGVFVGPGVLFTNDLRPRSPRLPQAKARYEDKGGWLVPTLVQRGASLGAGAVILAGVTVGDYATVGAGALVTKDVPSYALVLGTNKLAGWVCECGRSLAFKGALAACLCRLKYRKKGAAVSRT